MKILKLIIHNIASVSLATIDFGARPLADAEVFLITGVTGAGKTTILDSICLALFGQVPRMQRTEMTAKSVVGQDEVSASDTRQLLRNGTSEGSATLHFIANDNNTYIVEWAISRTTRSYKGNQAGKLKAVKRTLTCVSDPTVPIIDKERPVRARIEELIGLTYDQFCRTTMLAQGEFTRFLVSSDGDKAGILEKIIGKTDFTRAGVCIFQNYKAREENLARLRERLEALSLLSDDDRTALDNESASLTAANTTDAVSVKNIDAALTWLERHKALVRRRDTDNEALRRLTEQMESQQFTDRKRLLEEYSETAEPRARMAAEASMTAAIADTNAQIAALKKEYARYLAAKNLIRLTISNLNEAIEKDEKSKAAYGDRTGAFANHEEILSLFDKIISADKSIKATENRIKECDKKAESLNRVAASHHKALDKAIAETKPLTEALSASEARLRAIDITALATRLAAIDRQSSELESIEKLAASIQSAADNIDVADKKISSDRDTLSELKETVTALDKEHETLVAAEAEAIRRYTLAEATADEFASRIRALLTPGCQCPVCRQRVADVAADSTADTDAESELRRTLRDERDAATAILRDNEAETVRVKAHISLLDKQINEAESTLRKQREQLDKQRTALSDAIRDGGYAPDVVSTASELRVKLTDERRDVRSKISKVATLQTERDEITAQLNKVNAKAERVRADLDKTNNGIAGVNATRQTLTESRGNLRSTRRADVDTLCGIENITLWGVSDAPSCDIAAIRDRYINDRKEYTALASRISEMQEKLTRHVRELDDLSALDSRIPWRDIAPAGSAVSKPLLAINSILSSYTLLTARRDEAMKARQSARADIAAYLASNTRYTAEKLQQLSGLTEDEIKALATEIEHITRDSQRAADVCRRTADELDAHVKVRPEIADEENTETLTRQRDIITEQITERNRRIGAIQQQLNTDNDNRAKAGTLTQAIADATADRDRWHRLNDLLGSSDGKRFKSIALSYILNSLLDSANAYLARLTPRYTLAVEPGTYNIDIIDSYNGYTRRSANTSSGGESFMVSLALSLALSDISPRLSVDTLFIDEGFGTLSGEPLSNAVTLLRNLRHSSGRKVGIISHIEALSREIPVHINVIKDAATATSRITVSDS